MKLHTAEFTLISDYFYLCKTIIKYNRVYNINNNKLYSLSHGNKSSGFLSI